MLINKWLEDVEAKTGVSKFMQLLLLLLALSNVIWAANFMLMDKSVRTQLVPAQITKPFWVDGEHLSQEYLEQMGELIVMKFASVTPSSVDANNAQILKYVHPSVYADLQIRFKNSALKLKQDSISRYFFPREVRVAPQAQAVAFTGYVETWVGDKKVPNPEVKTYLVAFDYSKGLVTVKELRETSDKDPFAPPSLKAGEAS